MSGFLNYSLIHQNWPLLNLPLKRFLVLTEGLRAGFPENVAGAKRLGHQQILPSIQTVSAEEKAYPRLGMPSGWHKRLVEALTALT